MNGNRLRTTVIGLLVVVLIVQLSWTACAYSVMRYSYRNGNLRPLSFEIAKLLFFGMPEQNNYSCYYVYDNGELIVGDRHIHNYNDGSVSAWINAQITDGFLKVNNYGKYVPGK